MKQVQEEEAQAQAAAAEAARASEAAAAKKRQAAAPVEDEPPKKAMADAQANLEMPEEQDEEGKEEEMPLEEMPLEEDPRTPTTTATSSHRYPGDKRAQRARYAARASSLVCQMSRAAKGQQFKGRVRPKVSRI